MIPILGKLERQLFRKLNAVVEPLVLCGLGSWEQAPVSLIVLETTGFKSGKRRRTPLWSVRLGDYRLVSTVRGERSFWAKNLRAQPRTRFFLGGESRQAEAILLTPDYDNVDGWELSGALARLVAALSRIAAEGWAFALLVPEDKPVA